MASSKKKGNFLKNLGEKIFGGPQKTPDELFKEWRKDLRKEMRESNRQIRQIEREEKKVKAQLKAVAKKYPGDVKILQPMAKELVQSRKAKNRFHIMNANLNSCLMSLNQQRAMLKVSKSFASSTEILTMMNDMVKLPELNATMQKMAMQMQKAGLIEEMIDDTMEEMEPEDLDDLADEEVKNVVEELLGAKFIGASTAGLAAPVLPDAQVQVPAASAAETDLEKRLKAL